ncbi:MAG: hypothetical protein NT018_02725 [Armatimonadetes bacterium]|nr:hypothetical protein [Armatimonadota bacterium]
MRYVDAEGFALHVGYQPGAAYEGFRGRLGCLRAVWRCLRARWCGFWRSPFSSSLKIWKSVSVGLSKMIIAGLSEISERISDSLSGEMGVSIGFATLLTCNLPELVRMTGCLI